MKMYNVRDAWRIIPRSWTILFYILSLFFFSFSFSLVVMESSKEGIDGFLNIHRVLVVEFSTDRHDLSAREKIDFSHLAELLRRGWCVVESARTIFAATSILLAPHRRPQLYRVEGEGVLRVVKKESVAKFRISWRGGTDVTIRSLPRLVFRRSSHKC